jgi:hypothetical protein
MLSDFFSLSSSVSVFSSFRLPNVPERWRERKRKWMEKSSNSLFKCRTHHIPTQTQKALKGMVDLFLLPLPIHPEMRRIPVNRCCWWVWRISIVESFHHTKQKGKAIVDIMYTQ